MHRRARRRLASLFTSRNSARDSLAFDNKRKRHPIRMAPSWVYALLSGLSSSSSSAHHWCRCLALVLLGIDHEVPLRTFSFAFGTKLGFVAKGQMDDAALARRQRGKRIR